MSPFRRGKPAPRAAKPYTSALTPAVLAEARVELARQMALSSKGNGGRPTLASQKAASAAKRQPKSEAHREAIAEAMRAKWAARKGGASG